MSWFCIHQHTWAGTLYDPPEAWCDYENEVGDCDSCPYQYSREDYEADCADYEYDRQQRLF